MPQQIETITDDDLEVPGVETIGDEDVEGAISPKFTKELKGGTQPPLSLQEKHAANVKAGAAAYKPGWVESYKLGGLPYIQSQMMGAPALSGAMTQIAEAPKRFAETIMGAPAVIRDVLMGKSAQVGTKMIEGMTEPLMSPRTTGEAIAGGAADAALMGGLGKVATGAVRAEQAIGGAISRRVKPSTRATIHADRATNQLVAGIHPENVKTARAIKKGRADLDDFMEQTGATFEDSRSFSDKVAKPAASDFYETKYKPLAAELNGYPVEFRGTFQPFEQLLDRRGVIHKNLNRFGYFDKSEVGRSIAKTQPQVQALVEELDELKPVLDNAIDKLAPTNEGAANILRRYSNLKEIADEAGVTADRLELAKMIEAGQQEPAMAVFGDWLKDAGISAITLGINPALFRRWWSAMAQELHPSVASAMKREQYFARAAQNWSKGKPHIKSEYRPISRVAGPAPTTPTPSPINLPPTPSPQPAPQPTPQVAPRVTPQAPAQQAPIVPQAHRAPPLGTIPVAPAAAPPISPVPTPKIGGTRQLPTGQPNLIGYNSQPGQLSITLDRAAEPAELANQLKGINARVETYENTMGHQTITLRFNRVGDEQAAMAQLGIPAQEGVAGAQGVGNRPIRFGAAKPISSPSQPALPARSMPGVTPIGGGQYNINIGGGQQTLGINPGETLDDAVRRTQGTYANAPAVRQRMAQTGLPPGVKAQGHSYGRDLYTVKTATQGDVPIEVNFGEKLIDKVQEAWRLWGRVD